MRGHNIWFRCEIRKITIKYSLLSRALGRFCVLRVLNVVVLYYLLNVLKYGTPNGTLMVLGAQYVSMLGKVCTDVCCGRS